MDYDSLGLHLPAETDLVDPLWELFQPRDIFELSHGESSDEGRQGSEHDSGGSQKHQRIDLKQPPSTFTPHGVSPVPIFPAESPPYPSVSQRNEIPDYDVILGEPRTLTRGTLIYRQLRQKYARRRLKPEDLRKMRQQVSVEIGKDFGGHKEPAYWYRVAPKSSSLLASNKVRHDSILGFHRKSNKEYQLATDQALLDDVRHAKTKKRKRAQPIELDRNLPIKELLVQASILTGKWVNGDAVKELCAQGFRSDMQKLQAQNPNFMGETSSCESRKCDSLSSRIETHHKHQVEKRAVNTVLAAWDEMLERHMFAAKSSKSMESDKTAACLATATSPLISRKCSKEEIYTRASIPQASTKQQLEKGSDKDETAPAA